MSAPRFARSAAALLAKATEGDPPLPSPASRTRAIGALEEYIGRRARTRRRIRAAVTLAAAAALAAGTVLVAGRLHRAPVGAPPTLAVRGSRADPETQAGSLHASRSVTIIARPVAAGASVVVAGGRASLSDGATLGEGSRVVAAANGSAVLSLSTGTKLTVEEGGDLTILDETDTQLFTLSRGSLRAEVAKLGPGQRFVVRTGDAEIEVRGTSFRLQAGAPEARCGTKSTTRLTVFEGVVVVRAGGAEARVAAGEAWPAGCATGTPAGAQEPRERHARGEGPAASDPASLLGAQNDAFARALAAKRRGAVDEALAAFDRFLAEYPASPLAENAMVEKMRLVGARDRAGAASIARQYLAAYPNGFARAEALSQSGSP